MANAIYLKIDGAPGLSKNKGHEGEIELESYSFGASQQSTMGHGGGGGSGKVQFDQFTFHAKVGKESPEVWFALCQGKHIPKIVLTSEKAGGAGGPVKHVVIELKDCMFTHYSMSDSVGALDPQGGYSLDFAEAKFDYQPQNKEGGKDGAVITHSWNSAENKGS